MSKIVKKAFMFETFNSSEPVRIEEGNLISYEFYNDSNNIEITIYGPDSDIKLCGPTLYLRDYVRDVEYDDLVHPKEYMFEQQKDRTYRHGVTKNYGFVDNLDKVVEDGKNEEHDVKVTDETNQELKEATLTVIKYLRSIDCTNLEQTIVSFLGREEERLQKEYDRLNILTSSDDEIIQNALLYYANDYLSHYGTETADKIRDVRERYLDRKDKE